MMALTAAASSPSGMEPAAATGTERPTVHIAEIEVDPRQLDAYKTLLAEEQEASVRLELGVLMLHSVALADAPTHIRLLEVYADHAAAEAHLRSPHFLKYKASTGMMVTALRLIETTLILLWAKPQGRPGDVGACL